MKLETTLNMLAAHLRIDPAQLIAYADEDNAIGGYHWNAALGKWPTGSVFEVEGKVLYALVRYFKPLNIVEIGGLWGCSTAHMAAALKANGSGIITSVDNHTLPADHGGKIPAEYANYVKLVSSEGGEYFETLQNESVGLVFSDADHHTETTRRIAVAAIPKLIDGGLFIEHDAQHDWSIDGNGSRSPATEGKAIREGLDAAGLDYRTYLTEPSDCGLAISQIKHESKINLPIANFRLITEAPSLAVDPLTDNEKETLLSLRREAEPPPEPKKRTRRKRNAVTGKLE